MGVDERLSLDAVSAHTLIAAEHRHRYRVARAACAGRRVVDLCCGVGYGSAMLAEVAASVVGVDRDVAAVDAAQAAFEAQDLSFVAADALDFLRRLEPADVDVVVCFEGLEHVSELDEVAGQLARLVSGGVAVIASVPNSATLGEVNEHHLTDFDLPRARALAARLGGATIAFQTHAEGTLIRPAAGGPVEARVDVEGEQDLDWANAFLLLAGVDADALLGSAELHLAVGPVNHRYMKGLELANRRLLAENGRLGRERLGLAGAGGAARVLRDEQAETAARDEAQSLRNQLHDARVAVEQLRAEREEYRRAWVVVRASRITKLAARLAGHRF